MVENTPQLRWVKRKLSEIIIECMAMIIPNAYNILSKILAKKKSFTLNLSHENNNVCNLDGCNPH